MTDLAIPYGMLNQAANDIQNLTPEINRIQNTIRGGGRGADVELVPGLVNESNGDLGPGLDLVRALGDFYVAWQGPTSNAMDGLGKLEGYFKQIADAFEKADASSAASLNEGAAISAALAYPQAMQQYAQEVKYAIDPATGVRMYTPGPPPALPTDPYSLALSTGATTGITTTYQLGGVDSKAPTGPDSSKYPIDTIASETTTVNSDGMTYSETTTFGADQGWGPNGPTQDYTQVITNADGSTDTVTMTVNTSGHATMTDLNSATGQTSTYTRADWNAKFVDVTPPSTSTYTNPNGSSTPNDVR
jgi:hypothetical protein